MVKANLHGHVLPDYSEKWRKRFGLEGKNLAQVLADKCLEKDLEIYAITNEPSYSNFDVKSRFEQILEEARMLTGEYELGMLGVNAFVIRRRGDGKAVYFIDGQSIRVKMGDREAELLSFGSGKIPNKMPLEDTLKYLSDHGLPASAEHPLCLDHYGMGPETLERLCSDRSLTAVEHNAQLALPNIFSRLPKFSSYTKSRNEEAIRIANAYRIPVIANDDSNAISHIGTAYTNFITGSIRMDNGENMVQDLVKLINEKIFDTHRGYLSLPKWISWTTKALISK